MSIPKTIIFITILSFAVGDFNLTIIHVNDLHARFEETDTYSGTCKKIENPGQECYGGLSRLHQAVKDIQKDEPNSIFVNGGDFYQGTAWYTLFKWTVIAPFANMLNPTAMSPGNHEFDDGIDGYVPFLQNATFPVICANLDVSKEPDMEGLIKPSIVVERGGKRIGIIGYLTPETKVLADPENLIFKDEVASIKDEVAKLKADGINIIIALGHSGYEMDKKIAKEVEDIDVVVGGHSHSFLFTGAPPSNEQPVGDYPTLVEQNNGKIVPVVQAYAFTKYLGYLRVTFDDLGNVKSWVGSPILLNSSYPENLEMLEALEPWKDEIKNLSSIVIGETKVLLSTSRYQESNLGNFIADSMVDWFITHPESDGGTSLATKAGIISSGGIRGSLDVGNITLNDLLTVLPFANSVDLVTLNGSTIREVFEFSASKLDTSGFGVSGAFLQVSGFKVTIDVSRSAGARVSRLLIKEGSSSPFPAYAGVQDDKLYNIVMPNYLAEGGDGYAMIAEKKKHQVVGVEDVQVFKDYLAKMSPVDQGLESRIIVITNPTTTTIRPSSTTSGSTAVILSPAFSLLLLLVVWNL